ncbi:caspase family protein [Actinoplanes hulinensis]|uniref:Caspase family protein n=1 Tax=Actinoplanes hulinensis TaxID=1144547 RepID=A0ABS7B4J9_9ACTN|nr:caspase family protein [Actinoplanes hulinensis]MBW6435890.1 caspase family protein [Actinoplanes hulinensis]
MAGDVYLLLVGINDYGGRAETLNGCLNDIDGFRELLLDVIPRPWLRIRELRDAEATRQAVMDGFTEHLAQAGTGDAAVFYFAGYGSMEPDGDQRTIVCADGRAPGVPDLSEGEIRALIAEITPGGAHVLIILDCGHTEYGIAAFNTLARGLRPDPEPRRTSYDGDHNPPHVVLYAGAPSQPVVEQPIDGRVQGAFSAGLRKGLAKPGPFPYHAHINWAYYEVAEVVAHAQEPVGYAVPPASMEELTLGGLLRPRTPGAWLEGCRDQWWIDVGPAHGILPPVEGRTTVVAVRPQQPEGAPPLSRARVTEVEARHCRVTVDPGWDPDPGPRYPATVVDLPLPPTRFRLDGPPAAAALVRAAVTGSPHVREEPGGEFVVYARHGWLTIAGPDGTPLAAPAPATPEGAAVLRERLDHLGRWQVVKQLDNPVSTIARGQVRLHRTNHHRRPMLDTFQSWPTGPWDGHPVDLGHHPAAGGWSPYPADLSVGNETDRPLYCALLALTGDLRIHDRLLPTRLLPPHSGVDVSEAFAVAGVIPEDRWNGRAVVEEWWKIIVSEQPFDSAAFELPRLGEPIPARSEAVRGSRSVLDRLAVQAVTRDEATEPDGGPEWATALLTVRLHRSPEPFRR